MNKLYFSHCCLYIVELYTRDTLLAELEQMVPLKPFYEIFPSALLCPCGAGAWEDGPPRLYLLPAAFQLQGHIWVSVCSQERNIRPSGPQHTRFLHFPKVYSVHRIGNPCKEAVRPRLVLGKFVKELERFPV